MIQLILSILQDKKIRYYTTLISVVLIFPTIHFPFGEPSYIQYNFHFSGMLSDNMAKYLTGNGKGRLKRETELT